VRITVVAAIVGLVLVVTPPGADAAADGAWSAPDAGVAAVVARYRAQIPALMAKEHISGLALALVDGDQIVWAEGFGSTDADGGGPVTVDTAFSVQSMSKVFTATAVMQAVQAGRLDLDAPITTYLPGFTVRSAFEPHPEATITLRMLLSHTAGFTHEAPVGNNYEPDPGEFDAHVQSISRTWLRFPVGSGYAYSNLGIDLAGHILERVWNEPFPVVMRRSLLGPLDMDHSTFDRTQVHADPERAVGHSDQPLPPPVDTAMTAAGGLWASAADLAEFLRFQLGNGAIDGRRLLDAALMNEQRTIPAPHEDSPAGYALGVARTRWRAGQYLDLFSHGGGGGGFLSDLWWLPQLQLGIAVLTNSDDHPLQGALAESILFDLVTEPGSTYRERMLGLPTQSDVVEPDSVFVPPPGLAERIADVAMPASRDQARRWATYAGLYRTGQPGAMDPGNPTSRFHVESGVPYFDAAEDGIPLRHRLTEFQPGLFLAEDGETLDLREPSLYWRGVHLTRVTGGPLPAQWALLGAVGLVAGSWVVGTTVAFVRRRRRMAARPAVEISTADSMRGRVGRPMTVAVASFGAVAALATIAAVLLEPGLVDVGFLGRLAWPVGVRLAFHVPLAVVLLSAVLGTLLVAGATGRWWTRRLRPLDVSLAVALVALATQLVLWHLVAWGF
jgi:CubicO group peptidase (beta-lactamase class C family)